MLASLLPGLRDVRTPLTVGYLWLALFWLWWGEDVAEAVDRGDLAPRVRELIDWTGLAGSAATISFAAYVLGAVVTLPADRGFLRTVLGTVRGLIPNVDAWSVHDRYLAITDSLASEVRARAEATVPPGDELDDVLHAIDRAAQTLPVRLRPQLLVANQEMYGEYDRLEAESLFRINLCLPVLALAITLGAEVSGWFFLLGPIVSAVFLLQGLSRQYAAESVILEAVLAGVVEHPLLSLAPEQPSSS